MRTLTSMVVGFVIAVGMILVLPVTGHAQEASAIGTVTDSTGGVLPGVTITATHEATGNTFVSVTDERGVYRVPLRVGVFKIMAELPGFGTVTRTLELAVGQQAVVNLQLAPAALQESVTVSSQAPLVDVTQSKLGGNIDARQMQELPINGRNWMTLTLMAPGSRANAAQDSPVEREGGGNLQFQMNIDGQSVTNLGTTSRGGESRFSRDALGEFEFITNRFDATQGRTSGVQVNAVTKSGTNNYGGTASAYFRSDSFNASDFIVNRVLKYSDQQVSTTFGGPFKKDRAHFFGYYEGERQPQSVTFTSPLPRFNVADQTTIRTEQKYGVRLDAQFSANKHFMVRGARSTNLAPFDLPTTTPGSTRHPSRTSNLLVWSDQLFGSFTQMLGPNAVNELKGGYTSFHWYNDIWYWKGTATGGPLSARTSFETAPLVPGLLIPDDGHPPQILLRGYSFGTQTNYPQDIGMDQYHIRDNFTYVFSGAGRHDLKIGGEYLNVLTHLFWANSGYGSLDAQGGPIPGNIEDLFPVWDDWKTWNIAALSPITRFFQKSFGPTRLVYSPRDTGAAWFQDDWAVTKKLTLNLGVRYDVSIGSIADRVGPFPPFRLAEDIKSDWLNVAPRLGFAYAVTDKTVIRGGYGKYYSETLDQRNHITQQAIQTIILTALNDGRPNFAADPFNGQIPTYNSIVASGVRRSPGSTVAYPKDFHTPYSLQTSIGLQQQIGSTMNFEADYVWTGGRRDLYGRNVNLSYNAATGANNPFTDVSRLPYPQWDTVSLYFVDGWSNYQGLQTAFTKRFSNRWQAGATYTFAALRDASGAPSGPCWDAGVIGPCPAGFKVASDFGGDYTLGATDQRHRAVFNGIWQLPYSFQLSGLYFFGSGLRYATTYGGDLRNQGSGGESRLRPNGTIVPRNNFVGLPVHRVDVRLQRRFPIHGRAGVDGIFEVYNLFNHANYGAYTTVESNSAYGTPSQNANLAYQPRMLQLAFRFTF